MQTIDRYIDDALKASGLPSDRQLALHLKVNPTAVSWWRTKRAWPRDEMMGKLAELGGHNPDIALLELNAWRTKGDTSLCYRKMAEKLASIAAMWLILVGISGPAKAGTLAELGNIAAATTVYYGKSIVVFCL